MISAAATTIPLFLSLLTTTATALPSNLRKRAGLDDLISLPFYPAGQTFACNNGPLSAPNVQAVDGIKDRVKDRPIYAHFIHSCTVQPKLRLGEGRLSFCVPGDSLGEAGIVIAEGADVVKAIEMLEDTQRCPDAASGVNVGGIAPVGTGGNFIMVDKQSSPGPVLTNEEKKKLAPTVEESYDRWHGIHGTGG